MKLLPLILAGLWRKPTRTVLTMLAIAVAFLLFGVLQGINAGFESVVRQQRLDRLYIDARLLAAPLPRRYIDDIRDVPGIVHLTEVSFLAGYYQERTNPAFAIHTNPEEWLAIRPEWDYSRAELAAVLETRAGVMLSESVAKRNGFKIGDHFTLTTNVKKKDGSGDWEYVVAGIMKGPAGEDARTFLANWSYFDEGRADGTGTVYRFLMRIADPTRSTQISKEIDAMFATSAAPTRTISEQALAQTTVTDLGDVQFFTRAIIAAVFFGLLLLTSNTMMESVRERTAEIGVLKTLGFSDARIFGLVFAEALVMFIAAASLGFVAAELVFPYFGRFITVSKYTVVDSIPLQAIAVGIGVAVIAAFVSVAIPASRARRLNVVDALAVR